MAQLVADSTAKGRKRKPWAFVALEEVEENVSLRKAGQQWLASHEVIHKPLTNSSQEGRLTLIARCHACQSCTLQYCFSFDSDGRMRVEKVGSCGDSKNAEVLKRARAKAFAQHTPAQAVKLMRRQGIPEDEIPEEHQVKNQRYKLSKDKKLSVVPVESLDELRKFVANPPKGVCFLDEHMVVSEEKIVIPFCLKDSEKTNQILQDSELAAFLMDFTFQVNKEGLVVGSAGPVGLRVSETRAPVMSFLPVILMISTKEDQCAQQLLMNLWLERCHDLGLDVDFGFFDCSCFHAVDSACKESRLGITVRRCLQHVS